MALAVLVGFVMGCCVLVDAGVVVRVGDEANGDGTVFVAGDGDVDASLLSWGKTSVGW